MVSPRQVLPVLILLCIGSGFLPFAADARPETPASPEATVEQTTRIEKLLAQAHELEGSDSKTALAKALEAADAAKRLDLKPLELRGLLQTGKLDRLLNDLPAAMKCVHEGMDLATLLNDEHTLGEFFLLRGFVEWNQAKVPEATVSMMEAYRRGDALDDKALQIGALYGRGIVRARGDDLDGALSDLQSALKLAEDTRDPRLGQVLNSLGAIHLQRKDYPQARIFLGKALQELQGGTNLRAATYVRLNLGQVATETGDQETAGKLLDEAMAACQQYDFRRGMADAYFLQGARQRRLGQLDEAIRQLDLALGLAEKLNHPDLFVQIYEEYVQTEQARENFRAALDYNRKLAEELDIVRGEKTRRQAAEIQARYEAEHRVRQIKTLQRARDVQQADLTIKETELRQVQTVYTLLIVIMILGGVTFSALTSRQRAHARLAKRMLEETRAAKVAVEVEDARKGNLLDVVSRELQESEERFRSAFEHSPLGLTVVGLSGRWLRVNPALCKIVGYTEAEMLATDFQSISHPEDLESDLQLISRLLQGTIKTYSLEKRYLHKEGHEVWVRIDVTLRRNPADNRPAYFIAQVDDITARRRAREQLRVAKEIAEEANEAKNAFLSRMSHELRTPLNAILGFSQLLEDDDLGERQNQSVGHICTAGRHLLDLINEVLDITQIESGRLAINTEPTSVEEAVRGAVCLTEPLAREAGLSICAPPTSPESPLFIRADARRLRQVISNLLSNAVKYNRPGGEISIRYFLKNGWVRLEVADTGPGIALEDREKIFTAFTRLAATESIAGTGLGLSVSKALTEVMGGKISVESEVGVGSTFALEFEVLSAEEAAEEPLITLDALPLGFYDEAPPEVTVLYIEDIAENVELVRCIFESMPGIRLLSAQTGKTGLELAKAESPDLILLDLNLPDIPGAAALAQLRREPNLVEVPVIVITADASMSQAETLRSLGARDYLTHPIDLAQFRRVVEGSLAAARSA